MCYLVPGTVHNSVNYLRLRVNFMLCIFDRSQNKAGRARVLRLQGSANFSERKRARMACIYSRQPAGTTWGSLGQLVIRGGSTVPLSSALASVIFAKSFPHILMPSEHLFCWEEGWPSIPARILAERGSRTLGGESLASWTVTVVGEGEPHPDEQSTRGHCLRYSRFRRTFCQRK